LLEVSPRIVTPNGDNLNDLVFFKFSDSIVGIPLETNVVDINGGKISDLREKSGMDDVLTWDGKDSGGRDVPSGIYIYSIKLGGHQATGTVVVAR
jgi:flagellar hook assembly protein FlgD